jgi:hypothetical protein
MASLPYSIASPAGASEKFSLWPFNQGLKCLVIVRRLCTPPYCTPELILGFIVLLALGGAGQRGRAGLAGHSGTVEGRRLRLEAQVKQASLFTVRSFRAYEVGPQRCGERVLCVCIQAFWAFCDWERRGGKGGQGRPEHCEFCMTLQLQAAP